MHADEVKRYICDTFAGVSPVQSAGDTFFVYDPHDDLPAERMFPFAALLTSDSHDSASDLARRGSFRLDIGLMEATYRSRFGDATSEVDHTARDVLMPHPVHASRSWACVVDPAGLDGIAPLLAEAHELAARKHANRRAATS
ncbi:hypothetical protein GCM10027445_16410 [Amycolatopsis endophytica]|uniref:DUF6194 domain-containing protein n=1 Tax=Amycolatopsis endophytica TaxID=860233 RepID=A0A853B6I2_9PSEU|nr:DUF6194 family protein [Amycolatopsis endophytica]NYI90146.1 hypothetical protein [Amycolatopsis endophytica]